MNEAYLYSRNHPDHQTTVTVGTAHFGKSDGVIVVAGPCAVESYDQLYEVAFELKRLGISCMRAGVFKPRTSPYSFQGMGMEGLRILEAVRRETGLAVITEVVSIPQIEQAEPYLDCFQVGSRNMQHFELLKALGRQQKPVLLKRGMAATLDEFLLAAEYILMEGNSQVILCERGIRSFDDQTRNVLDLAGLALLKERTHLPVIADPSHATGRRNLIAPASRAAIAAGADGVMIETHPMPECSISDADQAFPLSEMQVLVPQLDVIATAMGKTLQLPVRNGAL